MLRNKFALVGILSTILLFISCSNQKNTKTTRLYHEINTRYNIYYNAELAYEEALYQKNKAYNDNLSRMIHLFPYYPPQDDGKMEKLGGFDTTIDKATKAIKTHSIQAKPERNPGKRGDASYQEWLSQREFNPFLKNAWMLMAKAEYQSLNYLQAISTFSYITRLFKTDSETVAEARLWMVKGYLQMGWIYEAENILRQIELTGGVPQSQQELFSSVYADYLIRNKKFADAVPYLQEAIKHESGLQKIRMKYLLGQLYSEIGEKNKAYQAFAQVQGMESPYQFTFNALIQQAQNSNIENPKEKERVLSSLTKMTKQSKNSEYLDQIYYAMGNIYLQGQDTAKAMSNYRLSVEKSTRDGFDKAMAQITLADIYFKQRDYVNAQPLYPEALGILGKKYERYAQLNLRSEVLDELVVHVKAIHLQDSLQTLAKMLPEDRMKAIDKIIAGIKKQQEEERKQAELEGRRQDIPESLELNPSQLPPQFTQGNAAASGFYFYNEQTIKLGKAAFKNQWGNRKLEDDWRRKNKTSASFDDFFKQENPNDSVPPSGNGNEENASGDQLAGGANNILSPQYYLNQLPLTEIAMQESNDIIEEAYYEMGLIYKNKLEDLSLAINAFETVIRRFPQTKHLEEIYYQLFLIYHQLGDKNLAEVYRTKLLTEFPKGNYAVTLSDPNYEWNLRNMSSLENALYQETYEAYLASRIDVVRQNYNTVKEKYALSTLAPQFMLLDALTYAQTNNPQEFKEKLRALIDKYPNSDVIPFASEMLKGLLSGKSLAAGGPARGMIWDVQFAGEDLGEGEGSFTAFADKQDAEYMMLFIFDPTKVQRNNLLYDVADYNFSNFILQTFDLSFSNMKTLEMLQVKGFASFNEASEYVDKIFADSSLIQKLDPSIVVLPISVDNYNVLLRGKSLNEYFAFFDVTYKTQMPKLTAYWDAQIEESEKRAAKEELALQESQKKKEEEPVKIEEKPVITVKEEPKTIVPKETPKTKEEELAKKAEEGVESIISDEKVGDIYNAVDDINSAINEVADNPVDGIKNIIQSIKNRPKLTKEEKAAAKEEKRIQKDLDKQQRAKQKAIQDSITSAEKAVQDSIDADVRQKAELERAAVKAKKDAQADVQKAKEEARKQRERDLKAKEQARKDQLKQREKERNEKLKARENERKERQKQREAELREKERQARQKQKNR